MVALLDELANFVNKFGFFQVVKTGLNQMVKTGLVFFRPTLLMVLPQNIFPWPSI